MDSKKTTLHFDVSDIMSLVHMDCQQIDYRVQKPLVHIARTILGTGVSSQFCSSPSFLSTCPAA